MNQGPLIFLGVLVALLASWFGLVFQPYVQLGNAQPETRTSGEAELYPVPRSGEAMRGLQLYRSLGCATCHSQQVRQSGAEFDVVLSKSGTNLAELVIAMVAVSDDLTPPEAGRLAERTPVTVVQGADEDTALAVVERLSVGDARAEIQVVPLGADIQRGWGRARSVAVDYIHDYPVMLGSRRLGPDLTNIGLRRPDPAWHLRHLYAPRSQEPKSVMPPYPFLFETRKIDLEPSAESLLLPEGFAPDQGYEIVPTEDALALVAYLMSLRTDAPLLARPLTGVVLAPSGSTDTNSPTGTPAEE